MVRKEWTGSMGMKGADDTPMTFLAMSPHHINLGDGAIERSHVAVHGQS